jgi:hypothetical protein
MHGRSSRLSSATSSRLMHASLNEVVRDDFLRKQICGVVRVRREMNWNSPHRYAVASERFYFMGIVGQQSDRSNIQVAKNLHRIFISSEVRGESELSVCREGVHPAVLQGVRLNLIEQTDSAAFLEKIDDDADAFGLDEIQGRLELIATITSKRMKDFARAALGVNPHGNVMSSVQVAFEDQQMLVAFLISNGADFECASERWKIGLR